MKIANKISLSFFITALVLTSISIPIFYLISKSKLKESILEHLSTVAESRANHITTYLESNKEAILQLSKSVVIKRLLITDKSDKDYQQRLNDVMIRLKETSEVAKYVFGMCVVDARGIVVASSEDEEIGRDKSKNEYFLGAKQGAFIKDAYICTLGGQRSIGFSAPIRDENNRLLGVAYMRFLMAAIDSITTNRTGLGKAGEIYLVNKYGLILTPSRFKKDTFLKQNVDTINVRNCLMYTDRQHVSGEKKISIFTNYSGVRVLGTYEYIPQIQWCLLAEIDEKEVFASLLWIKIFALILMAFIPSAAYLISFFISRGISKPIHKLHKGTEVIGQGNLDYKTNVRTQDEIGQLSIAFDKMTEDLKKTTTSIMNLDKEITERKKAEEEREVLIKELRERQELLSKQKQKVDDSRRAIKNVARDLEKSKEKLEEQKKSLEEINKELDDFTYIVSHDLKEPLRSIDAFSKFIEDDYKERLGEEGRNYFERIRANASRMQALIDDLLEISRIERRKGSFEEVQIEELINEVELRLEYAIKQRNAEIIIRDKLSRVFCDRIRLTEVFINLISNAIKFNDKPNPHIEIGCSEKSVFYEFYVKDNGPGIEEQYFDKIFEIFQRLGKREEQEGTGAGLTIVKKIVQMHKGRIWLESKLGEGTTFYFTIPKEKEVILGKKRLGEILIEKKLLTQEELKKALEEQEGMG